MLLEPAGLMTRAGLDQVRKEMAQLHPGTDAFRLIGSCHPSAGVDLIYTGQGTMRVWCHRCTREVAVLHVASAPLRCEPAP